MPTIAEAIQKFRAIQSTAGRAEATLSGVISRQLEGLIDTTDKKNISEKVSTLRTQLVQLASRSVFSEAARYTLVALCDKYPENDIDLFQLGDNDETLFFPTSGYVYGKEWLRQYISIKGYENPFNRQPFSDEDKKIISEATGIGLDYCPPHHRDERLDLTEQAVDQEDRLPAETRVPARRRTAQNMQFETSQDVIATLRHANIQFNEAAVTISTSLHVEIRRLVANNMLSQENFNRVATRTNPDGLTEGLILLRNANITNQEYINLVVTAQNYPPYLADQLCCLQAYNLLTIEIATAISANRVLDNAVRILLSTAGILNQQNLNEVRTHDDPVRLAWAFCVLSNAGILEENRELIKNNSLLANATACFQTLGITAAKFETMRRNPSIATAVIALANTTSLDHRILLNVNNFSAICAHENPALLAKAVNALYERRSVYGEQLLTQEKFDDITRSPWLAVAIASLENTDICTRLDFDRFKAINQNLEAFARALTSLKEIGALTNNTIDLMMEYKQFPAYILSLINTGIFNKENYEAILYQLVPESGSGRRDYAEERSLHMVNALIALNNKNLLTSANRDVLKNNPVLATAIVSLDAANILTQSNFDAVHNAAYSSVLMSDVKPSGMSSDTIVVRRSDDELIAYWLENRRVEVGYCDSSNALDIIGALPAVGEQSQEPVLLQKIISKYNCTHSKALAIMVSCFHQEGILNQTNFDEVKNALSTHSNPNALAYVLGMLRHVRSQGQYSPTVNLFTLENREKVLRHPGIDGLQFALTGLDRASIFTQENFDIVIQYANPQLLGDILNLNRSVVIQNFKKIVEHPQSEVLAKVVYFLTVPGNECVSYISTPAKFNAVANHPHLQDLCEIFEEFKKAHILDNQHIHLIMERFGSDPTNCKQKLMDLIPTFQKFITVAELRQCIADYKPSMASRFLGGKPGPELEKLRALVAGQDNHCIGFLQIYNCISFSGGKTSLQRADILMNSATTDSTDVGEVIMKIRGKLTSLAPQPTAQPQA